MEGKLLLIVILALVTDISSGSPHRRHHHRNPERHSHNICRSSGLKLAFRILQSDTEDIKRHIRCRMDNETCSESMLDTNDGDRTPFQLNDICNENFLHSLKVGLGQFYTDFSRIRAHITILQSDGTLNTTDPLQPLTNRLSNDIGSAIQTCEENVALSRPLTETSTSTIVESGELFMLVDLIQTINNFDNFISNVYNILIHQ